MQQQEKKAVITILGKVNDEQDKATYYFKENKEEILKYHNMFALLIEKYQNSEYEIVPIYTKKARETNENMLKDSNLSFGNWDERFFIKDFNDINQVFAIINEAVKSYDKLIIDVSHGFRHLPMLMIVDLIIENFEDTSKIEKILFTRVIIELKEYEIIDLKDYLDIANIMFVVSSFKHNFTTSNIEVSSKYSGFINSLREVSNDLLSLNINHLTKQDGQGSADKLLKNIQKLQEELEKETQNKEHFLINPLKDLAEFVKGLINFEGKKYYQTYFELSEMFYKRDYLINSIALLCESARYFIKTQLKRECPELKDKIEQVENRLGTYETLRFFSGLSRIATNRDNGNYIPNHRDQSQYWRKFNWVAIDKDKSDVIKNTFQNRDSQNSDDYNALQRKCMATNGTLSKVSMLSDEIDDLRNKLVHINPNNDFDEIKRQINEKIERYKEIIDEDTPTN
ncbi:TM1812 family CRISPR-associated protein [Helicobacter cetorum]|uniref:TM1812 family CRISPR-associated protein n=1 Tax=Helicobacter cetorum TaxID=138563 RepID=UPI000CF19593|nr:TM1812 family CRISPR-associated protein [Helicobacter cetorum]